MPIIKLYEPKYFNIQINRNVINYRIYHQGKQIKRSTGIKKGDFKQYKQLNSFLKKLDELKYFNNTSEIEKIIFKKKDAVKLSETKIEIKSHETISDIFELAKSSILKPTSAANVNKYKNAVDKFNTLYPSFDIKNIERKTIRDFIYKCMDMNLSYFTISGYKTMIVTLLTFAFDEGIISSIPK